MRELSCDVLICGGGVGGCAAAMAVCSLGYKVIMTDPNEWIGGQLTSQAVPPDEHPWIEEFGCTKRYREFRNKVRDYYRDNFPLNAAAKSKPNLNPGGGWVSWLCHEPRVAWQVLNGMLAPYVSSGSLIVLNRTKPVRANVVDDRVKSVEVLSMTWGDELILTAKYFLDATELGELLPMTGTDYVTGAESQDDTGEKHAVPGGPQPQNIQGFTHVLAIAWDPAGGHAIEKPSNYDRWRTYRPNFWPGQILGWKVIGAHDGLVKNLPLVNPDDHEYELLSYRQCIDPSIYSAGWSGHLATLVNWPQNDYFVKSIIDVGEEEAKSALTESRDLSMSLLYWMQTEAPRHDGGVGYSELYLRPDITGTESGEAQYPYIRESRRIKAQFTVKEQHVSASDNPRSDRAQSFWDSVGIGAYRIDLHPSTGGDGIIDFSALPFQIPLGALLPVRMRNLLPACKNIGTTHVTNGCYRLHPVEWNIGESAGILASYCLGKGMEPQQIPDSAGRMKDFQALLVQEGIEISWPNTELHAL